MASVRMRTTTGQPPELPARRRQVSPDGRKPAKPPSASAGAPVDPSSLLILGPDSLSYLLRYFDVASLARFEGVCKQFRQLAAQRWKALDAQIPAKGRSKADAARVRVIRYHLALSACKEIEPKIAEDHKYHEYANSRCQFPGSKYILDTKGTDQNELFCRCVEKSSGTLLAQGFCTAKSSVAYFTNRYFFFKDLDLSSWPAMKDLVENLEGLTDFRTALENVMKDLSVVVVEISKDVCPEICVVSAVNKMQDRDGFGMQGRRKYYSREMNTMFILPPTSTEPTYIISRLKKIVTRFKVGDPYEKECDGQVLLRVETYI